MFIKDAVVVNIGTIHINVCHAMYNLVKGHKEKLNGIVLASYSYTEFLA